MTIVSGLRVDRATEFELTDDLGGFEAEGLLHGDLDRFLGNRSSAEGVDVDRDGIRMADCIGELDLAASGKACSDNILRHVAAHVGSGAIDLRGILSGEGATTVAAHSAVGIDDDLATSKTGIPLRASDHETSGWVDEELGLLRQHLGGDDLADHLLDAELLDLLVGSSFCMLGGDHNIDDACWLPVDILDGDLALCIGAEPLGRTAFAKAGKFATKAVGIHDWGRHELRSLVAGIAKHESLVSGTLLGGFLSLGLLGIDTLCDVGALRGDDVVDEDGVGVEDVVVVVVTDLADRIADDLAQIQSGFEWGALELGNGDLATDHHDIALGIGLTGDPAGGVQGQAGIEDSVRNSIANFVGVAFADGFGREDVAA